MIKVLNCRNKSFHLPPLRICPNFDSFLKFGFCQWTPYLFAHYIFCRRWVGIFFCPFPKRCQKFQKGSQDEVWLPRGSIYWFYGGQWRIELILERWRLVHYTKVLVAQGCAPPNSAWHQVWVNEGSIHWFHCGRSWSELVLEKWRLVHYTKVLVAQGC